MSGPFHHGQCLYWIWHNTYDTVTGGSVVARPDRTEPGVLRFGAHRRLGLRQYIYGTPLGAPLGKERFAAHEHGHRLVVRWVAGGMAE